MTKEITITAQNKKEKYIEILPQIKNLIEGENDLIANLANVSAALKYAMGFFWVGFYLVNDNELVLGPFQGPVACTRIKKGKGVCGTAWQKATTIIVPDVEKFEGHIACSSESKSEIVIPLFDGGKNVWAVLDVDSDKLNGFDEVDSFYLNELLKNIKI
jgi:L-methionine (R)-S-oxide reductase